MADSPALDTRPRHRRVAAAAGAAVLAAAGVVLGLTLATSTSAYRTVAARDATVEQTVTVTGSVEPVNRVTLSFGVEGIVATVAVHVDERVAAGQTLATLRTTALSRQVFEDRAELRAAQAAVTADETDQAGGGGSGSTSATAPGSTSGGSGGTGGTSGGKPAGTATPTLHAAQQAVVSAQKAADAAEESAAQALAAADTACGTTSTGGTAAAKGSPTTTTSTTQPAHGSGPGTACATALHDALVAQQALATDERAVTTAETALAKVLSEDKTTTGTTGGTVPPSTTTTTTPTLPSTGATGTGVTPVGSATTPMSQAAQLADDQATVDTDDATLLTAQQSLAEADLTAPIAGTVGTVDIAAGQATGSGSETAAFTILTQHAFEADGLVSPTQVPQLATGDSVRVNVDGRSSTITGRVTRIGPVDTTLGFQYPVVVALPARTSGLFTGSLCQMTVVERVVRHTLAVPTSAVHTRHGRSTVTVLRNGKTVRVPVGVGIVGMDETQILDGLHRGEAVVLADLTRTLPKPPSVSGRSRNGIPVTVPGGHFFIVGNGGSGYVSYAPLVRPTG